MNFVLTLLLSFDNLKEIDYNNWNGEVMTVVEVVVVSDPYVIVEWQHCAQVELIRNIANS